MLANPAFTSQWQSDRFLIRDYKLPLALDDDANFDFLSDFTQPTATGNAGSSRGTSGASSECSVDDLYIEGDDDDCLFRAPILSVEQSQTPVGSIDSLSIDVNWPDDCNDLVSMLSLPIECELSLSPVQPAPEVSESHTPSVSPETNHQAHSSKSFQHRKWSQLSAAERLQTVEDLSSTISCQLGLREQLEVIKIINPTASVAPKDTEFVIDLDSIDDEKLEKIRDFVSFHSKGEPDIADSNRSKHSPNKKHSKKTKNCERRTPQKIPRHRQRKDHRQLVKERQSGLFVREEILALSSSPPGGEEEDIDILE